jgi:hypothetical protein
MGDPPSQVSSLSGQNELLKRKERLLQISVRTSEDTLSNLTSPSLDKNLTELIKVCVCVRGGGLAAMGLHAMLPGPR